MEEQRIDELQQHLAKELAFQPMQVLGVPISLRPLIVGATIEQVTCVGDDCPSLYAMSRSMIDQYRRASKQ
jgi:hypothetical protein